MILVLGLLVGAVAWTSVSAPAQSYSRQTRPITEYDLKVAYVYNFARYFTWPKEAFADARAPFVIGVLGDDPLGRGLDDVARRKTVRGRRIEIRRFKAWKDYKTCQILFVPRTLERDILAEAVKRTRNSTLLLVGETPGFAVQGGTVNFFPGAAGTIGFEINVDAVAQRKLRVDARLLKLAKVVERSPQP